MYVLKGQTFACRVSIEGQSVRKSVLTGSSLRQYKVSFEIADSEERKGIAEALKQGTGLTLDINGESLRVRRGNWHTSEQVGRDHMSFVVELLEREAIVPTAITLGKLTLHPSRYDELALDGRRYIVVTVILDAQTTTALRECLREEAVQITRHGVSEIPIELWPGQAVHSQCPGGLTKTRFVLRERGELESQLDIALKNALYLLADERRRTDRLLQVLVEKGLITQEEVQSVIARCTDAHREIIYTMLEIEDADTWLDLVSDLS